MVLVSYSGREINAKLVYYGPGLSGKTTNLEYIYGSIPQGQRGKMVSMKTKTERTLFFDFLPVNLGELSGFKTRFLLYTVPGQVYYNATRKLVLKGVDAVVFVADSKRGKMDENLESLDNLRQNLLEQGVDLDTIPWVMQYNKRDLPDVYTIDELEEVLNPGKVPVFEAVAMTGQGVVDTFKGVSRLLLRRLSKDIGAPAASRPATGPEQAPAAAGYGSGAAEAPEPVHEAERAGYHPEPVRKAERVEYRFGAAHDAEPAAHGSEARSKEEYGDVRRSAHEFTTPLRAETGFDQDTESPEDQPGIRYAAASAPIPEAEQTGGYTDVDPRAGDRIDDDYGQEQDRRGFSVGDRLRRWLSRPNGHEDAQSQPSLEEPVESQGQPSQDAPGVTGGHQPPDNPPERETPVVTGQESPDVPPEFEAPVAAGQQSGSQDADHRTGPAVAEPQAQCTEPGQSEPSPALPRAPRQPRPVRPREVLVPLELSRKDLETGITLKLVLQMPQEGCAEEGEEEEAA